MKIGSGNMGSGMGKTWASKGRHVLFSYLPPLFAASSE